MKKAIFFFSIMINLSPIFSDNITLCYHQFGYSFSNIYGLTPELFKWQINYLRENRLKIYSESEMIDFYTKKDLTNDNNIFITIDDGWKSILNVTDFIEKEKIEATVFLIPYILDRGKKYLTMKQVDYLKSIKNITFGSHGYSHRVLRNLTDDEIDQEIVESKKELETILDKKIRTFSYPYGEYDKNSYNMVKKNYKLAFTTSGGINSKNEPKFLIKRYILLNTTTFGEFKDIINQLVGGDLGYKILSRGYGNNKFKYFNFEKIKLYRFGNQENHKKILIIPSSNTAPAWFNKTVESFTEKGITSYVMVTRNNNIQIYRPEKELRSINNWSLDDYIEDIKTAIDNVYTKEKIVVITWQDGFDLLMATIKKYNYSDKIGLILTINPSILADKKSDFENNIKNLSKQSDKGKYSIRDLDVFLKLKTLSDLAILDERGASPFSKRLDFKSDTNLNIFLKYLNLSYNQKFSFDEDVTTDDFKSVFFSPMPAFNKLVPINLIEGINNFWINNLEADNNKDITFDTVILFSDYYKKNLRRIKNTFDNLNIKNQIPLGNYSISEIFLSNKTISLINREIDYFFMLDF